MSKKNKNKKSKVNNTKEEITGSVESETSEVEFIDITPDDILDTNDSEIIDDELFEIEADETEFIEASKETSVNKKPNIIFKVIPHKNDSKKEIIRKSIFIISFIALIVCGALAINEYRQEREIKDLNSKLISTYNPDASSIVEDSSSEDESSDNSPKLLPSVDQLLAMNDETVGWIKVPNTNVNFPVVQYQGEDLKENGNKYYLNRDFERKENIFGAIFLDYRVPLTATKGPDNLVIYGHNNSKSNTMFAELHKYNKYNNLTFYKENPTFTFNTNYEKGTYKIFAYFVTNADKVGEMFDYHNRLYFNTQEDWDDFYNNCMKRTYVETPVDVEWGDQILTLSTCSNEFNNARFVIMARKVREGEDPSVDTSLAKTNPDPFRPQQWLNLYGNKD